ncbi:hypothetical protein V2W45_1380691 [Cenococcum geophilum]
MALLTPPNQQFIGYYPAGGTSPSPHSCNSDSLFTTSGTYGDCCAITAASFGGGGCAFATGCAGATGVLVSPASVLPCTGDGQCHIQTIFSNFPVDIGITKAICVENTFSAFTLYRSYPSLTTSSSSTLSTSPTVSSSSTLTPTPAPAPKSDKAWIAGVVIGPIAAVVIAGLVGWIIILYKRQNRVTAAQNSQTEYKPPDRLVNQSIQFN